MSYVEINNIVKTYNKQQVLKRVSLSIEEGEFITLLGPSGCGKSTLLRAVAGLNEIDAGTISVGGKDITSLPPKDRQVGMVFQSYALFPNMTVYGNIAFGLRMEGMKAADIQAKVDEMIALMDLQGKEHSYPSQLSGGQQQRVALARSLVKQPKILLLDEPLSALDAKIRRTLRGEIRQIQRRLKMTTIFVTHDQEEALTISDRIYVMNHGVIEQSGTPHEIYTSPQSEFVARFIGNYNVWERQEVGFDRFLGVSEQHGEIIAVRPEVIQIEPIEGPETLMQEGEITAVGTIEMFSVLGNVMRFDVDLSGLKATVDTLHGNSIEWAKIGSQVRIRIPVNEWKTVQKKSPAEVVR